MRAISQLHVDSSCPNANQPALNCLLLSRYWARKMKYHEVKAVAKSSIGEDCASRSCRVRPDAYPQQVGSTFPLLGVYALWCNFVLGDNRRTYIYCSPTFWHLYGFCSFLHCSHWSPRLVKKPLLWSNWVKMVRTL